jgi:hypothetical protein
MTALYLLAVGYWWECVKNFEAKTQLRTEISPFLVQKEALVSFHLISGFFM